MPFTADLLPVQDEPCIRPTWIVVYRPHNELNCLTKYYGPFADYGDAEDCLVALGALGVHVVDEDTTCPNPGCKFIQELTPCLR